MSVVKVLLVVAAALIVAFVSVAANGQNEDAETKEVRLHKYWSYRFKIGLDLDMHKSSMPQDMFERAVQECTAKRMNEYYKQQHEGEEQAERTRQQQYQDIQKLWNCMAGTSPDPSSAEHRAQSRMCGRRVLEERREEMNAERR